MRLRTLIWPGARRSIDAQATPLTSGEEVSLQARVDANEAQTPEAGHLGERPAVNNLRGDFGDGNRRYC
jgi:hypothetical protein